MRTVLFLMWKELLELKQNPRLFPVIFLAPLIELTVLGYAATTDVRDIPVVVADTDRSVQSRELIGRFEASANFTVIDVVGGIDEVDPSVTRRWATTGSRQTRPGASR